MFKNLSEIFSAELKFHKIDSWTGWTLCRGPSQNGSRRSIMLFWREGILTGTCLRGKKKNIGWTK
jgi:hypothetical protein